MKNVPSAYSAKLLLVPILSLLIFLFPRHADTQGGNVNFTSIPPWGQTGSLTGSVFGISADRVNLYIFLFIPDYGWVPQGGCIPVPIRSTGEFSVELSQILDRYATRFNAYLVPKEIPVTCRPTAAALPYIVESNAVASRSVPRQREYRTIRFGGLEWYVKSAPVKVYPGPQFFADENAFVDSMGRLHLRVSRCSDSWCAAEIYTKERVGFGTYTFNVESQLNNLDPNLTLGLFTWDEQSAAQFHREWDIEFSRWGNVASGSNAQFVVQPYDGPNNILRFLMSPVPSSTHQVSWSGSQVRFSSYSGPSPSGQPITQWTYAGGATPVPSLGDTRLHLNFYVGSGTAPAVPADREIIISNVQYVPATPQIGFSRTDESASFVARTSSVNVESSSAACTAHVESDSAWLTVAGPNPVNGGSSFQYSIASNQGQSRTGRLILSSSNCNLRIERQVLIVNQAGLVCDPSFETSSTHLGFIAALRSVMIRATAPSCTWSVTPSAPWLRITSISSGAGDADIEVAADTNAGQDLRQGALFLHNGKEHRFFQDAAGTMLAISPSTALRCPGIEPTLSATWITPESGIDLRAGSSTGQLLGSYGSSGSTELRGFADGVIIYLIGRDSGRILSSARLSVRIGECNEPRLSPSGIVNAASYSSLAIPSGGLASAFGTMLSSATQAAVAVPFPNVLGGTSVSISGVNTPVSYVSPSQVNFVVPASIPSGRHQIRIGTSVSEVLITPVAPGIFTANGRGSGAPVASIISVLADGTRIDTNAFTCAAGVCSASAIPIREGLKEMHIVLYGTGFRNLKTASANAGPASAEVLYAGPTAEFPGVDQVNLVLRRFDNLAGRQILRIVADGMEANPVELLFQ